MNGTVEYLGFRFLDADMDGVRAALSQALENGKFGYMVTPNVDHVVQYSRNGGELARAYDEAMFQICDSRVLAMLARLVGKRLRPVPGSDITESLLSKPLPGNPTIAVIGPDKQAFDLLCQRFPHVRLVHIESEDRLQVGSPVWNRTVDRARDTEWDLLLICLSFPKQEFFARDLKRSGRRTGVALCVGASVDFLTGRQIRAPRAMQRMGLEWLYRLVSDPARMFERYVIRGPAIFSIVLKDALTPAQQRRSAPLIRDANGPRKVLFLTTVLPNRPQTGGEIFSMNFIEGLKAAGCDVEAIGYERETTGPREPLPSGFISPRALTIESADSKLKTAIWFLKAMLTGRPFSVQKYITPEMTALVRERLRSADWDLVVIDHAQAGWLLKEVPDRFQIVHIAHNAEHRLYDQQADELASQRGLRNWVKAAIYRREGHRMWNMERTMGRRFREIWSATRDDAKTYEALLPQSTVRVLDAPGKTPPPGAPVTHPSTDIGLLGNWTWDANRVGLEWFVNEVAPLLPPNLKITIAGRSHQPPGTHIGNCNFIGFANDATEFLRSSKVVAIPSTAGSGIQIKTVETLALGLPTVATDVAVRGLSNLPKYLTVVSAAEEMAQTLDEALKAADSDPDEGRRWWLQRRAQFDDVIRLAVSEVVPRAPEPEDHTHHRLAAAE